MPSQTSVEKLYFNKLLSGSLLNPLVQSPSGEQNFPGKNRFTPPFILLLSGWALLNLLQSYFTPIANDEAYYWMFSRNLAWGYFDHPPMIAAFIKTGDLILHSEWSTRLVTVFAQLFSLILIWKIIDDKEPTTKKVWIYFSIAASIPVFAIYGFIATPDSPLLLFTALFLYSYKRFIEKGNLQNVIIMSLAMAGLMYSKYHGALVILLVVLSNVRLLMNPRFWISALLGGILFIPHMLWQFRHGFPTLEFQMMDRMESIHTQHFFEYWLNQAIAFNPVILFILVLILLRRKPSSIFDRSLFFIPLGFFGFFWISSMWTRSEPHWTAAASIPVIILAFRFLAEDQKRWSRAAIWITCSLILIAIARLTIILDFLPIHHEFRQQKKWAYEVSAKAGDLPAVFVNTYQKPSVYSFYTGKTSFSLNNVHYRKNQYDIWDFEESFQNKEVAFFVKPSDSLRITNDFSGSINGFSHFNDTLYSFQNLAVEFNLPENKVFEAGEALQLTATVTSNSSHPVNWDHHGISLSAVFIKNKMLTRMPVTIKENPDRLEPVDQIELDITCQIPNIPAGNYGFFLGYQTDLLPEAFHSRPQNIQIAAVPR